MEEHVCQRLPSWRWGGHTGIALARRTAGLQLAFRRTPVGGRMKEGTCAYGSDRLPGRAGARHLAQGLARSRCCACWENHGQGADLVRPLGMVLPPRPASKKACWARGGGRAETSLWGALSARTHHKYGEGLHLGPRAAPLSRTRHGDSFSPWAHLRFRPCAMTLASKPGGLWVKDKGWGVPLGSDAWFPGPGLPHSRSPRSTRDDCLPATVTPST